MYPHERSLVKQLADKPFALIGVNSDKDLVFARKAVEEKDLSWRSFWNGEDGVLGPIAIRWSNYSWPTIYLIDAKGIIRYKNVHGAELDEAITKLMAEAGHEVNLTEDEDDKEMKDDKEMEKKEEAEE